MISKDEPCYECLCDEYFNNSTTLNLNKNCRRKFCQIQINNGDKVRAGCAPIYLEPSNICCPINYRCRKFEMRYIERNVIKI